MTLYSVFQKGNLSLILTCRAELLARVGHGADLYSSHSFRGGGATYAFESGVPSELIHLHGD